MERLAQEAQQLKRLSESMESSTEMEKPKSDKHNPNRLKKHGKGANTSLNSSTQRDGSDKKNRKKGQKLYCICRTPYDKSRYVICFFNRYYFKISIN